MQTLSRVGPKSDVDSMSKNLDVALKMAETHAEKEMNSKINARMRANIADIGHGDGLRALVLTQIANENYQQAIDEIYQYIDSKHEYPMFKQRVTRYAEYCRDLVNGIKAKRSFPGMQYLSSTKQQELFDRSMDHFDDLKATLKRIEQIEREVRLDDVRSTVWVVKALVVSVAGILIIAFFLDISKGVISAAMNIVEDSYLKSLAWLFTKLGI